METRGHKMIGEMIVGKLMAGISKAERRMFLLGCIEPDINAFSYLKGFGRAKTFMGHNYENSKKWVKKTIWQLDSRDEFSKRDFFRLGKLIHYVIDGFTFAHNDEFLGTLSEHVEYEQKLQKKLDKTESGQFFNCSVKVNPLGLRETIENRHYRYIRSEKGVSYDLKWIAEMCRTICGHYRYQISMAQQRQGNLVLQR